MRTTETKTRPEEKYEAVISKTCDLCGKKQDVTSMHSQENWGPNDSDAYDYITVERSRLNPSGLRERSQTTESYDVCPDCWEERIKGYFLHHNAQPTREEETW